MTAHDPIAPGTAWMEILQRPSLAEFARAFSSSVVIEASVLPSALTGVHDIRAFFEATKKMYTTVRFTSESSDGSRTLLGWDGEFSGEPVSGITVLEHDAGGRIGAIHLHHRPLPAVLAFSVDLGRRLEGQLDGDPFPR